MGILDLGRNLDGHTTAERMTATVALARQAEAAGLGCYWLAEHHVPLSAHCAPEVVIPLLAASTDRLRLGHAGLLLRYYSPLKVAEVYLALESAFPGRIDLGICRGPGVVVDEVAQSLVWGNDAELDPSALDSKVDDLMALFGRGPDSAERGSTGPFPVSGRRPATWILGTSRRSADQAVRHHLPYGLMLFQPATSGFGPQVADHYRAGASAEGFEPTLALATTVLCRSTEEAARRREQELKGSGMAHRIVGDPTHCAQALDQLARHHHADVVVAATFSYEVGDHLALMEGLGRYRELGTPRS